MKEKKPKPPSPRERGEKWELMNGEIVTVIGCYGRDPLNVRIIEVVNERGMLTSIYESDFKRLLTGEKHE